MRSPHAGTNRVHKDDFKNFEALCLISGLEITSSTKMQRTKELHVNVKRSYVPPKSRKRAIRDIELVLKYSRRVNGSCVQAYMGSMAMHRYDNILDGTPLAEVELWQIIEAHKLVFGYLDLAKR